MEQKHFYNYCQDNDLKKEYHHMVSVNAYYRAEKKYFESGRELDDWYNAELEITNIYRYWFNY
ncbi:MAG: DUF2934 domain-containing protein [Methylococcales bacterium]|jgi:hypothetical protein|nr:DUF2934 domain-containing protein [Methylococcales bacterium]